jgi:peptide chain release factor
MSNEIIVQITSGRGPAECCWVVAQVLKTILMEAENKGFRYEVISRNAGMEAGTLVSAMVKFEGNKVTEFAQQWHGSVLWVGQSPYRKFHKRKNWFVGVNIVNLEETVQWSEKDITYQTLRSSGPGGQHVNKTESAVRAIHEPSGIQVTASNSRSKLQNKSFCFHRL